MQSRPRACPQHHRCDSGTTRDGAGTGAEPEDDLEGVSEPALGDDCGHGFFHGRSRDSARFAAVRNPFAACAIPAISTFRVDQSMKNRTMNRMSQIARNLTDSEDGILIGKRYLIHDRDRLFTAEFLNLIADAGVESVKLPPRSPKSERLRGEICTQHQGVLPESHETR